MTAIICRACAGCIEKRIFSIGFFEQMSSYWRCIFARIGETSNTSDSDLRAKKDNDKDAVSRELRDLKALGPESTDDWVLVSRLESTTMKMPIPLKDDSYQSRS